jgi:hypothetical protein
MHWGGKLPKYTPEISRNFPAWEAGKIVVPHSRVMISKKGSGEESSGVFRVLRTLLHSLFCRRRGALFL